MVQGALRPELSPDDPVVLEFLKGWAGKSYLHAPGGTEPPSLVLVGPHPVDERPRWWVHLLLLGVTLFTTHLAGAMMLGVDPLGARPVALGPLVLPWPTTFDGAALASGAAFALVFMGILMGHEMGHYLTARRHGVRVTPPFFVPFPAYYSVVGTLGAFIRIKGPTVRRSVLLDIGAAGPVTSLLLSVPALVVGLTLSAHVPGAANPATPFLIRFGGYDIALGSSILLDGVASLVISDWGQGRLLLHPMAFAGWLGLFVTALNLLPLGQLDGGHILYALSPRRQVAAARLFLLALVPLGALWWGWWFWGLVSVVVSRGRLAHPPVLQADAPLSRPQVALAWAAILIFLLTFSPRPIVF